MEPCDRFGIFKDTAAAIFAAVALRFFLRRIVFTEVALLALFNAGCVVLVATEFPAIVVDVEVVDDDVVEGDEVEGDVVVVGNALTYGTERGSALSVCELSPNCP